MALCKKISPTPKVAIAQIGSQMIAAISTMHQPSIQMTPASRYSLKSKLNVHATRMSVSSSNTSIRPRVSR